LEGIGQLLALSSPFLEVKVAESKKVGKDEVNEAGQ
jgi:hypothetical protein